MKITSILEHNRQKAQNIERRKTSFYKKELVENTNL